MAERRSTSPWAIDPISWVTTSGMPLTATLVLVTYGLVAILTEGANTTPGAWLQGAALGILAAVGVVIHLRSRPPRGMLTPVVVAALSPLMIAGVLLSALGYRGETFALTLWWAPLAVSLLLIAAAPYLRSFAIIALGVVQIASTSVITVALVVPDDDRWPALTSVIIAITPIVAGTTTSAVLSRSIVRRLLQWSERPLPMPSMAPDGIDDQALAHSVDGEVSEQLSSAIAFLRGVADRGAVDETDMQRARALALDLRHTLLAEATATWLERVVRGHPVELDDPDRLADRLTVAQRTALRAMLDALMAHPESGFVSARIALRASDDHEVAVAMRISTTLPEGRRVTFLAPYYVSLSAAVRDIRWRDGADLEVSFAAPAETTTGRAPLVQRTPRATPAHRSEPGES